MIVRAYAKINLALYVNGKRPDGFHDIETLFAQVGLFDTIRMTRAPEIIVAADRPDVPSGPGNLAYRAAELMQKAFCVKSGVRIDIRKNIPAGGGLAGGSSDAAAVVKGLQKLWKLPPAPAKIRRILRALGSDVPFCYLGGCALGRGRGEKLRSLPPFFPFHVVFVFPPVAIRTAWAYHALKRNLTPYDRSIRLYRDYVSTARGRRPVRELLHNDFEQAVFEKYPAIREVRERFRAFSPEGALMSGSGSTVFGLFTQKSAAQAALAGFRKKGFRAVLTRLKTPPKRKK
ncbi:MAG: 4-(cytidine 5'-diphospho)-2-C-methyl-D-erythritol kinase [Fibrobacterota bacterium]